MADKYDDYSKVERLVSDMVGSCKNHLRESLPATLLNAI